MKLVLFIILVFSIFSYSDVVTSRDLKPTKNEEMLDVIMFKDGDYSKCRILDTTSTSVLMERKGSKGKIKKSLIEYIVLNSDTIKFSLEKTNNSSKKLNVTKDTATTVDYKRTINISGVGNSEYVKNNNFFKEEQKFRIKFDVLEIKSKKNDDNIDEYASKLKDFILDNSDIINSNYISAYSVNPNVVKEIYGIIVFDRKGNVDCVPQKGLKEKSPIRYNIIEICEDFTKRSGVVYNTEIYFKIKFAKVYISTKPTNQIPVLIK